MPIKPRHRAELGAPESGLRRRTLVYAWIGPMTSSPSDEPPAPASHELALPRCEREALSSACESASQRSRARHHRRQAEDALSVASEEELPRFLIEPQAVQILQRLLAEDHRVIVANMTLLRPDFGCMYATSSGV
jgi:hypothetical protein